MRGTFCKHLINLHVILLISKQSGGPGPSSNPPKGGKDKKLYSLFITLSSHSHQPCVLIITSSIPTVQLLPRIPMTHGWTTNHVVPTLPHTQRERVIWKRPATCPLYWWQDRQSTDTCRSGTVKSCLLCQLSHFDCPIRIGRSRTLGEENFLEPTMYVHVSV